MARIPERIISALRWARRHTVFGPLQDAFWLRSVIRRIDADLHEIRVVGPDEFSPYLRCLTPLSAIDPEGPIRPFDFVIVRQDQLSGLPISVLKSLRGHFTVVASNRRYILFKESDAASLTAHASHAEMSTRIDALLSRPMHTGTPPIGGIRWRDRGILVTTFGRATALERSLPQIAALGAPVLVVDDGSIGSEAERNRSLCQATGAAYLHIPVNRGLSGALNIGLHYFLADSEIEWISYLQDDVDVTADALERLARVEHAHDRPILTGFDSPFHPNLSEAQVGDEVVRLKKNSSGVHLHAHRDYWAGVLPIPTEYLGAPKRRWGSSLEDLWITGGAPKSAEKRGIPIVCVPGLVRSFLLHHGESTWGNAFQPDLELAPPTRADASHDAPS